MEAFEIVRLVGASIALVVGAIVFLVVFFRSMSWLDHWIKNRNDAGPSRPAGKRRKRPRRFIASDWDSLVREPKFVTTEMQKLSPNNMSGSQPKTLPFDKVTTKLHHDLKAPAQTLASGALPSASVAVDNFGAADRHIEADATPECSDSVTKSANRIATIHLVSGETMERVAFCSRDRVRKICDRIGFEGVVFENDEGQIWVVRESNIQMVTWKTSQAALTGHSGMAK